MDKRYQVFVSSTYQDLQEERREVMQALLELDCIPAGMELFPASSEDQWSLIKRVIDDCDYYLLIVGGRYGSTNASGISYTEMEYDYAASTGKPMICFLPKHPEKIESGKTEQTEAGKKALAAFKEKVQHKMVKFYESPADLGSVVSRSAVKLIKNFPAVGWVKANAIDLTENTKPTIPADTTGFFEYALCHIGSVKSVDMAFHAGYEWRRGTFKVSLLNSLLNKITNLRILVNTADVVESVSKSMSQPLKKYPSYNENLNEWKQLAQQFPEQIKVRTPLVPMLHRIYIVRGEKVGYANVKYYTYGNYIPEADFRHSFTSNDDGYNLYHSEFLYLWNHSH